jgi:hypothetical protein
MADDNEKWEEWLRAAEERADRTGEEIQDDEPRRWLYSLRADPDVEIGKTLDDALEQWWGLASAYKTPETVETVVRTIPEYEGISGYLYLFFADDGDVVVFLEDWLSGCIPGDLAEKYHPYPYESEEVQDYCLQAILPQGKALDAALAPHGFELVVDSPLDCSSGDCTTRFAWVRSSR